MRTTAFRVVDSFLSFCIQLSVFIVNVHFMQHARTHAQRREAELITVPLKL